MVANKIGAQPIPYYRLSQGDESSAQFETWLDLAIISGSS
jgi:hypothetical protein